MTELPMIRRRLFRFRLSFLFLLTSICAVSLFVFVLRPEFQRRQLISEIESLGGTVDYDDGAEFTLFKSQRVACVTLEQPDLVQIMREALRSFPNLSTLVIRSFHLSSGQVQASGKRIALAVGNDDFFDAVSAAIGMLPETLENVPNGAIEIQSAELTEINIATKR
jgi:hypothetical protein